MESFMKPSIVVSALIALIFNASVAARPAAEYLPEDADLDPAIPSPESVLGWEVGDWHVSHDKLARYMQVLADASPRLTLKTMGYSHEQRPLLQLTVTASANHQKLETLRRSHLDGDGPLVVQLGYSVHGNEPSGGNAALLVAYYLAAARSTTVNELLEGTVVLIEPCLNPDGFDRFASWANSNAGKNPVSDPVTRQHNENWPRGRTNHYGFDLNRDLLPLVHPESRARIVEYHRWLPHVVTDQHEQGRFPGFFFQPGVPTRQNPLTPPANLELTRALAGYHASALDRAGQPYFTEDVYDDFYFGKGSTYPDINGSVGILFEQRAIGGQSLETSNGIETFRMAIANQLSASLSTLRGSWALRQRLMDYQRGFHPAMLKRAEQGRVSAWVVGDDGDPERARAFLATLDLHHIEYLPLAGSLRVGSEEFSPGRAWVIPTQQRQSALLEAIMEQRTEFRDSTFYDVSAWTLPLAYNLPFAAVDKLPDTAAPTPASGGTAPPADAVAWTIPWNQLRAPRTLQALLGAGLRVRTAVKPFSAQTDRGLQSFDRGTLLLQAGIQDDEVLEAGIDILRQAALNGLEVFALPSAMTASGPDLGARDFKLIRPIRPLIVGGKGSNAYEVGEYWYLLDQRLDMPAPIVEMQHFDDVDLTDYTHLLMADGEYGRLGRAHGPAIARWVGAGGILLTSGRAAGWAEQLCFEAAADCPEKEPTAEADSEVASRAYADFADDLAQQFIGGAIVAALADVSHPLAFGYRRAQVPLFRRGTVELAASRNPYATPVRYSDEPLLAGFIGAERLAAIRGAPAVIAERQGQGLVVRYANPPLFRGFWRGTERLFVNGLFLGQVVEATDLPEDQARTRSATPGD
jgi:hypothetical protein